MKVLMVTPYPPLRDGIATYAVQSVKALIAEGHEVEVLSPGPSAAQHHLDLVGPRGAAALAKRARHFDKVIVQFHPDFFFPVGAGRLKRSNEAVALKWAFRMAKQVEVVVHEVDFRWGASASVRAMWRAVDRVVVHTESERDRFIEAFGVKAAKVVLTEHGGSFVPATTHTRTSARASFGIPADAFVFLSIGFIQQHKGFDRAVTAFGRLDAKGAELHVVGSVRVDEPAYVAYANELEQMVGRTPGAYMHRGFVSDELFDRWIVAADCVVLPYREIWSSGVMERARLYDRSVVACDVGGLREQAGDDDAIVIVGDDDELAVAMGQVFGRVEGQLADMPSAWDLSESTNLRESVQAQVNARAARLRGTTVVPRAGHGPARSGAGLVSAGALAGPLRQIPKLEFATTESSSSVGRFAKKFIRRLSRWELNPVVQHANALHAATATAVEQLAALEARLEESAQSDDD